MESLNVLLVDTSSKILKLAFSIDGKDFYKDLDEGYRHIENLFPVLDKSFQELNIKKDNIKITGVCTGPGSFTGIRIGIASVRAVSYSLNIGCFGFSVFDVYRFLLKDFKDSIIVSVIDGKKRKFYCSFIEFGKTIEMHDLSLIEINEKTDKLKSLNKNIIFTGSDFKLIKDKIEVRFCT